LQEFGKGVPLHSLPPSQQLFLCGFKADRTDIFFRQPDLAGGFSEEEQIGVGDLVVVEGDRGKDIGTVVNCSITAEQVEHFLAHQNELLALAGKADGSLGRPVRAISPKRLFHKATSAELSMLPSKAQDEEKALQLVQTKVIQRGLPMQVIAAEFQWDHRKLTIYYQSSQRVDFRDLVKELFRLYKSRIWL
ncbi:PSP1-domain-containing protein, partial [Ceraceosorus guamensis]